MRDRRSWFIAGLVVCAAITYWFGFRAPLTVRVNGTCGRWDQGAERLTLEPVTARHWASKTFVYYEIDAAAAGWQDVRARYRFAKTGFPTYARLMLRTRGPWKTGPVSAPESADALFVLVTGSEESAWKVSSGKVVIRRAMFREDCDVLSAQIALERTYPESKYWPPPVVPVVETLSLTGTRVCFDRGTAINMFDPTLARRIEVLQDWLKEDPGLKEVLPAMSGLESDAGEHPRTREE